MGLILNVYRAAGADCTNGGVTATCDRICVINVDGPFNTAFCQPAFELANRACGPVLVPVGGGGPGMIGPMFGGNYAATSDTRFRDAVGGLTAAIPVFDRYETADQYNANFN